jgi:hypothetical protein
MATRRHAYDVVDRAREHLSSLRPSRDVRRVAQSGQRQPYGGRAVPRPEAAERRSEDRTNRGVSGRAATAGRPHTPPPRRHFPKTFSSKGRRRRRRRRSRDQLTKLSTGTVLARPVAGHTSSSRPIPAASLYSHSDRGRGGPDPARWPPTHPGRGSGCRWNAPGDRLQILPGPSSRLAEAETEKTRTVAGQLEGIG